MKRNPAFIFLLFTLFLIFPLKIYGDKADIVAEKLQRIYEKAEDFTADFVQKSYNRTFNKWVTGKGKVFLKKGGKMRWEYYGKNAQIIVTDGKLMWVYQPEAKEVVVSPLKSSVARTPVNFLEGMGNLRKDFKVEMINLKDYPSDRYYVLQLVPREKMPNLTRMLLIIKKKDLSVVEVRTYDFYSNENIITFSNQKLNSGLDESLFHFKIPPGTRVLKMPAR